MCKEGIRLARSCRVATKIVGVVLGATIDAIGRNADRIRLTASLFAYDVVANGTVTGNVDPATGNVNEAYSVPQGPTLQVCFRDGSSLVALAVLSRETPTAVLRIEDYGPSLLEQITVQVSQGPNCTVHLTEVSLERELSES